MGKIRIPDGKNSDPGWDKFGSGIKKKRASATMLRRLKIFIKLSTLTLLAEKDIDWYGSRTLHLV
jgi:hypothetical protein